MRQHVLRNAMLPVVTMLGMDIAHRAGRRRAASRLSSACRGWATSRSSRCSQFDLPKILGVTVFASVIVIGFNLLVDLLYAWIDPRIRL